MCRKFNVLFRRDILSNFVQLRLSHAEFNMFNRTWRSKKLRMITIRSFFGNYSI